MKLTLPPLLPVHPFSFLSHPLLLSILLSSLLSSSPVKTHSLHSLHTILSTGSPLKPQSYEYVYSKIKKNVLLGSITGAPPFSFAFSLSLSLSHTHTIAYMVLACIYTRMSILSLAVSFPSLLSLPSPLLSSPSPAGGTDIISCFAGQNPTLPVYKGEIQSRNLGMAIESWSEDGMKTRLGRWSPNGSR